MDGQAGELVAARRGHDRINGVALAIVEVDDHLADEQLAQVLLAVGIQVLPHLAGDRPPHRKRREVDLIDGAAVMNGVDARHNGRHRRGIGVPVDVRVVVRRRHPVTAHHEVVAGPCRHRVVARPAKEGVIRAAPADGLLGFLGQGEGERAVIPNRMERRQTADSLELNGLVLVIRGALVVTAPQEQGQHALVRRRDRAAIHLDADRAQQHRRGIDARRVGHDGLANGTRQPVIGHLDGDILDSRLVKVAPTIAVGVVIDLSRQGRQVVILNRGDHKLLVGCNRGPHGI